MSNNVSGDEGSFSSGEVEVHEEAVKDDSNQHDHQHQHNHSVVPTNSSVPNNSANIQPPTNKKKRNLPGTPGMLS